MMPPYMSVKVRWTTTLSTTCPTLYEQCLNSLTSHRFFINYNCARACETGRTVYRPYPRSSTRKSTRLQMLLQSYLKTLIVGPGGV